ncbi:MAG: hypothetical protein HKN49_14015 [Gammaproteobacteria bacterium]|nr:hypothetical protein [Gammaproteobacteria bacterium]
MRRSFTLVAVVLLSLGCDSQAPVTESAVTTLDIFGCEERIDYDDPNETTFHVCPGVADYQLIVRKVGSGRKSIDVVTPDGEIYPLDLQDTVSRDMIELSDEATWRVQSTDGKLLPVAVVVGVAVRGSLDDPTKITARYHTIARIAGSESCITTRLADNEVNAAQVEALADKAVNQPCLPALSGAPDPY